ncbi:MULTISPECIES: hypoxanthine phosphoribosyltransferase [Aerococcus]|uniref:hypoxanthine phosphoribosyltransferase n=1 Tax=Aerococcus TaxID=1375 RepID=UPI000DCDBC3D|nr:MULTISPECIES: hypoxanthine phosphoribosyltransferase [Aerococcus]KAA9297861.1 hypoxanthine phosphoribosyltransferase [Aerococcus tenax]MDK6688949.1 hypoxanthine phosphoribosyltransferase [Aerococcus urinae]MDK8484983.1 hypoxanthine phosphoribosyltransferase [Aerococcus urinae]MDL5179168.1 hypoxanthine phosphoribosyltransferase [Aerococcus tenax]MDL5208068.1 hypoxanthine phosphoribosyltransferase [Aerococcus tenax]
MNQEISDILISTEEIQAINKRLGEEISKDYQDQDLLVVGILKGSFLFMADLIREINVPLEVDFMAVSSYGDGTESGGDVKILKDLEASVAGRHVLLVEDIVDTGYTLERLGEVFKERQAASVKICAFLNKADRRQVKVEADYLGKEIPDAFVVGYGMDYAQKYRNLPYVGVLKSDQA